MRQNTQMIEKKVRNRITKEERTVWIDLNRTEVELSDIHGSKTYDGKTFFQEWEVVIGPVQKNNNTKEK